jgi:hypothetical protein
MKYALFILSSLLNIGITFAQDPFWDTDFPTFPTSTYEDQNNTAFGMLDQTNYPSNHIYDRTDYISKVLDMDGNNTTDIINYDDWLTMYAEMQLAIQSITSLVPPVQEDVAVVWKRAKNRYEETDDAIIEGNLNIPIGIINYNYHKLKPNAIDDNLVFVDGESLKDTPGATENPFEQRRVFAATPMLDTVESQTLHFIVDADFYFQNTCPNWTSFRIDFDDGNGYQMVSAGNTYTINYASAGEKVFRFEMNCGGTVLRNEARLFIQAFLTVGGGGSSNSRIFDSPYDTKYDIQVGNLKAKLGIKFGCNNTARIIRKPILLVSGYNPFRLSSLNSFYGKYNGGAQLDDLVAKDFDIIVFRANRGADKTSNGSDLVEAAINYINDQKQLAGSNIENIVIGYSYGALIARLALARMEKDHFDNGGSFHHSKLYFSYEGEHQGANIPLGYQHAIDALQFEPAVLPICHFLLLDVDFISGVFLEGAQDADSKLAREILVTHHEQTGTPNSPASAPDPSRQVLLNQYDATVHQYTEADGYPSQTRNIALSKGASDATMFDFDAGEALYGFDRFFFTGVFNIRQRMRVRAVDGGTTVYQRQVARQFFFSSWKNMIDIRKTVPADEAPVDNANGSTLLVGSAAPWVMAICHATLFPTDFTSERDCFVPVYSALDIQNRTDFSDPYYDVRANELLFQNPLSDVNSFFGYPHLKYASPRDVTPFEAVFSMNENDLHSPKTDNEIPSIREFYKTEIQTDTIRLQNRRIGQYIFNYKADFEAINRIEVGEDITFLTPSGNVSIENNAEVKLRAGGAIVFEPGALVETGSVLDARIQTIPNCSSSISEEQNELQYSLSSLEFSQNDVESFEAVQVYPNPNQGSFTVQCDEEVEQIAIYNLSGKRIEFTRQNTTINTVAKDGIYVVEMLTKEGNTYYTKMIIQ